MTETEWLACTDPAPMLWFLRDKASDRKLRLAACAYCRSVWRFMGKARCTHLQVQQNSVLATDDLFQQVVIPATLQPLATHTSFFPMLFQKG